MMETTGGQDLMSCAEVASLLEKEVSEEPLSSEEQRSVERHLSHCAGCRDFVRLTSNLPLFVDELSKDDVDAAIRAVMANEDNFGRTTHSPKDTWLIFAAAASIAAITLVGASLLSVVPESPSAPSLAFRCEPSAPSELVPGVFMTYCDGLAPHAVVEDDGDVRVALPAGTVGFSIDPQRPHQRPVVVTTPLGEVRVKGTVFTVRVGRGNAVVEVFRGVVEVVPATRTGAVYEVSAGYGAMLLNHTTFELSDPKTEMLRQRLAEAVAAAGDDTPTAAIGDETSSKDTPEEIPPESLDEPSAPENPERRELSGSRHGAGAPSRQRSASLDALIQDAQSCLIDREWKCAAARYREALKRYSGLPESKAVLISLAKIELRHLNAPKEALAHFRKYQQQVPNGPLAEEALFGTAQAYRRLGIEDKERETLRLFIERYPQSSMRKKAQARLTQLGAGEL